ncbi:MAG: dihydrodipicolinate synthase family protein [Saprospiraceae bacterium]|nr:dihydrodipicolinate synthase family protein [Saprospiraceae bacterium]
MSLPAGVFAATLTPMQSDLQVDHAALYAHCTGLIEQGGNGIALMGTTGEANSLTLQERLEVLERLLASGFPATRLIVGTGCCAIGETVHLTRHATAAGVGGVLMLPPFYYKQVTDEGLYQYFATVIESVGQPAPEIYLYHFPRMSGIHMSTDLVVQLVHDFPGIIVGMKDSSGDLTHMREVMTALPRFRLYAGNEHFLLDVLELGGAGCISATTNYRIDLAARVFRAWQAGGVPLGLAQQMQQTRAAFEGYGFTAALKAIQARTSGQSWWNHLRPPLTPLSPADVDQIANDLAAIEAA